jgi:hypothetical protein
MKVCAFLFLLLLVPLQGFGHSLSDSYLELHFDSSTVVGHWQIAVQDLELAIGLDSNGDAEVSWGEVQAKVPEMHAYARDNLQIERGGIACNYSFGPTRLSDLNAGMFAYLPLMGQCTDVGAATLHYDLLFDIDSSHRGIATVYEEDRLHSFLFSPEQRSATLAQRSASLLTHMMNFVVEGVWHIWIGLDHILFLVALLLPIVLGSKKSYAPISSKASMLREIFKVITAFTVAHSITLIMASLNIVSLPSRLVESLIALSVAISGFNIIVPIFRGRHWQIAFGFGLIHGFGFAGVLSDLSLPTVQYISGLLSFNVGVEIGQLVIVLLLVPVLLVLGAVNYMRLATRLCAGVGITVFGVLWVAERYWGLSILVS